MNEPIASPGSTEQISDSLSLEDLFQQALEQHQSGNLYEAGSLYQAILKQQPDHAEANHKLGLVAVQAEQPEAGLPYFEAALNADPTCKIYWVSYIDVLLQTSQYDEAQAVLALARQHGLEGEETDTLAERIADSLSASQVAKEQPASAIRGGPGRSPKQRDMQALLTLFRQQRFKEMERDARTLTRYYPHHPFGWKMLGIALQLQGDSRAAIAPTKKAIELMPGDIESHYNLGVVFQNLAQLENAASCYLQALVLNPSYGDAALNLGVVYHRLGKLEDAVNSLKQALSLNPNSAKAHGNLGTTLQDMGRLAEAEVSFRRSVDITPSSPIALNNLGSVLQKQGLQSEAETCFRKALDIDPNYADAHAKLAITLRAQDRLHDAEISINNALRLQPDDAKLHNNLAIILQTLGRLDEADAHLQIAMHITPENAEVSGNRANLLRRMGRMVEAEACYRRASQLEPENADWHAGLGDILKNMKRWSDAEASYRKSLALMPDIPDRLGYLGFTLQNMGLTEEAEACYRRILYLHPDNAGTLSNLGVLLMSQGRVDEAEPILRHAVLLKPDCANLRSNLLHYLTLSSTADKEMIHQEHLQYGQCFDHLATNITQTYLQSCDLERPLQIGFVSSDFNKHAVASFIEPILTCLSGKSGLVLHAYYNDHTYDELTQRLKSHFAHWTLIANHTDDEIASQVRTDQIDILIDLNGHTAGNRLPVFAYKPAPIQASWIGYPGTTGLSAVDYYLADRFLLPTGTFDDQFVEKIVRLPAIAPFQPDDNAPPVNALPATQNGYVTFGSFNRPYKLSRPVIALWARLLRALPTSRMILGAMPQAGSYDWLIDWFTTEGITRDRLDFHPRASMNDYLELHRQVDLCLDTFPYNGGTTTHHALWMGVPTLTLASDRMPGRVGAANLGHVDLGEFVVEHADDFVTCGLYWANHLPRLAELRIELRNRLIQAPLRKPTLLANGLELALRTMWRRWCNGLPAISFEVSLSDLNGYIES